MSSIIPPLLPSGSDGALPVPAESHAIQPYEPAAALAPAGPPPEEGGLNIARLGAALLRYKWLTILLTAVGLAGGIAATRVVSPEYEVYATIYATPQGNNYDRSAVSAGALMQNAGWRDLIQSYAVIDPVVEELSLYLRPDRANDAPLFATFKLDPNGRFRPGEYTLKTEGGRYTLTDKIGLVNEVGTVGDSIGRVAGFAWAPSARLLGTRKRSVDFTVLAPREASVDVKSRFTVEVALTSPIIRLTLRGTKQQKPAETLNAMLKRFVEVSTEIKKRELVQSTTTLASQLQDAQARLQGAERQLETYRVGAITKPSETPVAVIPNAAGEGLGNAQVSQPVFGSYFAQKAAVDALHHDITTLEGIAPNIRDPQSVTVYGQILAVPTLAKDEASLALRQAIAEWIQADQKLRQDLQIYRDSMPQIKDERRSMDDLRTRVIPARYAEYLATLRERVTDQERLFASAKSELQEIPTRTIEQGKLERERNVQSEIYTKLRSEYARANLTEQSAIPDVKIVDNAIMPSQPASNTAPRLIGLGIFAGLVLGLLLSLLLDRLDTRFRYPDQAQSELGLDVLGVVPVVNQNGRQSAEAVAQIVEAFRSIRMNVRYAFGGQPGIAFGITSPGPGDGKSLIASNLALSFAEGGWRTVLVDADTRRGQLHGTFDAAPSPGLVEYLEGTSLIGEVIRETRHDNLSIIPCGTRHRRTPELLATPRMRQLVAALSSEFDVVIIDTPPLGAGTDAYAIGTACGHLAVVLRANKTNIKLAKAKLKVAASLPITLLGSILNEVRTDTGMYQYYSYDADYVMPEELPALNAGHEVGAD